MNLKFATPVKKDLQTVKSSFNRELFEYLAPPFPPATVERFDGCKKGDEVHLKMVVGTWVSVITEDQEIPGAWWFVDEGKVLPWPLKFWRHVHLVEQTPEGSLIIDDIEVRTSSKLLDKMIYPVLWKIFSLRPERYQSFFSR